MEKNIKQDNINEFETSSENLELVDIKNKFEAGCLVLYKSINEEQMNILLEQLADSISYKLDIVRKILNDDKLFLMFLDILAGETINIPNRKQIFQCLDRTFMYTYVKKRGFTEEAFAAVAKHFGEKLAIAKQKILRVSKVLDGAEYESLIKTQEKLKKQRKKQRELNRLSRENKEKASNNIE